MVSRNIIKSSHLVQAPLEHGNQDDAIQSAEDDIHSALTQTKGQNQDLIEDAELLVEDRELDLDLQGPVNQSTPAILVSPGTLLFMVHYTVYF